MDEEVDILEPPLFKPNGVVKPREQAFADGDWIGTFNLWIVTRTPTPAIIYQQRSHTKSWAPGLLDLTAGGHYRAGERLVDGLREVEEELGKQYNPKDIIYLGRKMYVGRDSSHRARNNIVEVYMIEDNSALESYHLEPDEVEGICICPVSDLLKVHKDGSHRFTTQLLSHTGKISDLIITHASFPENWDNYHQKMAILADKHFKGESDLMC